ncbi:MAG TPA: hypothetical protein VJT49_34500 [Amycolatopsis sp.]|uniref:hypothetical protein n=1 Tax=Amycolatopsis sp. TaxID=37632 RepID=UPI002B4845A2|nr:hypothetical protein [Amycolatopsis sp.]HKS50131.1 hypothetical protein [Amycolatopsis sp.]
MRYATYLRYEGSCWILIGLIMVISSWPGLLVPEESVAASFVMGLVISVVWLGVALRIRRTPFRRVARWMAGGRAPKREREGKPMTNAAILLGLTRDVLFWGGGTVLFYVLCQIVQASPEVSNGAVSLGIGAAVMVFGLLEAIPASRYAAGEDSSRGEATIVLRHQMMAFAGPILVRGQIAEGAARSPGGGSGNRRESRAT